MAKDIHDELGSGLSKIKFMSEVVSRKAQNNTEVLVGIKSISDTSIKLVENMRDLIWALNPENITLDGLVARIREYSYDYLTDTDKKLQFNITESIPSVKINTEAHRNIFFITKEALQNIVKHANASEIIITLKLNDFFSLNIADNGTGINETHIQGNGLRNMKQRAEVIGATLNIKSSQKGTEINLVIALKKLLK
jgi:signal transduction histidine kinase